MRGCDCPLLDLLRNDGGQLVVPVYQRNYDWKAENCERLFDDIIALSKDGKRKAHFLGNIVTCESAGNSNVRLIVDGQQRLITVSLLLKAIYDLLIDNAMITSDRVGLKDDIYCLLVKQSGVPIPHPRRNVVPYCLDLSETDQEDYKKLFQKSEPYNATSKIITNYKFFKEKVEKSISNQEITVEALFDNINKLVVINVELDANDDPQLVFESLNSTGVALFAGDKIRNFILMDLDLETQKKYYNDYWRKIEDNTRKGMQENIDSFVYCYLRAKTRKLGNQRRIYEEFKQYKEGVGTDVDLLLKDMHKYAGKYNILLGGKLIGTLRSKPKVVSQNDCKLTEEIEACISRLNWLETSVVRPFLMEVLGLLEVGQLKLQETLEIFQIVESYIYRRKICDKPSNVLNKLFVELDGKIRKIDGTASNYLNKFKAIICQFSGREAFPNDSEFRDAFEKRDVYATRPICNYTLERLECFGIKGARDDCYKQIKRGVITIEHIMPQTLTNEWQYELGNNYTRIHTEWLNRIANLTLTGYNPELSNASFRRKAEIYAKDSVKLTNEIAKHNKWSEKQLKERSSALAERALKIWARPNVGRDRVSLGDTNVSFKKLQIIGFIYKNEDEQKVASWSEMFKEVVCLRIFDLARRGEFKEYLRNNPGMKGWMRYFDSEDRFIKGVQFAPDLFYESNTNTERKIKILRGLFGFFKLDPNDLVFVLN